METIQEITFTMMNQDFIKFDRFHGTNFNRWKEKILFLLTTMKILYLLNPTLAPLSLPEDDDSDQIKVERKMRVEDEILCYGHILNTLSNRLYDLYASLLSLREI